MSLRNFAITNIIFTEGFHIFFFKSSQFYFTVIALMFNVREDTAGGGAEVNNERVSFCPGFSLCWPGLVSSVLGSLQSPGVPRVPLHAVVRQP